MIDKFPLTFQGRKFWINFEMPLDVRGGPFREMVGLRQTNATLICLKEEATKDEKVAATYYLPITDFSVPKPSEEAKVRATVEKAMRHALNGGIVYAGCMGGTGRTGLFFALMTKAAGHGRPVQYVRANYRKHAVETKQQEEYVADMNMLDLYHRLNNDMFWAWLGRKTGLSLTDFLNRRAARRAARR